MKLSESKQQVEEGISPGNIGGMGPIQLPTDTEPGSGDVPTRRKSKEDEDDEKEEVKEMKDFIPTFEVFINEARDLSDSNTMKLRDAKAINEWGGSDQHAMNQSIHRELRKPKTMPSPFDKKLRRAAEGAVDFYWDEWPEYNKDYEGLVDNAVRNYLRNMFRDDFNTMVRMFEPVDEGYTEDDINTGYGFYGTINTKEDDKTTRYLFDRSVKDLMKEFKISEEAALVVLNSKMGRKAADQIIDGQSKTAVDALKDYYGKTLKKEIDVVIKENKE